MRLDFRFTEGADREITEILETTNERFGPAALRRYQVLLGQAIRDLTEDPPELVFTQSTVAFIIIFGTPAVGSQVIG
jgi:plasmid stabilization system protein ParE